MALRAGHRIGMTAGDDVKHFFLEADIGHRLCERRIDVAEQEVDLIAFDQLVGFLHRDRGFAAGRIFDEQIDFTAENAALGVDLIDGELRAEEFVFSDGGECAGQRVVEANLHVVGRTRGNHEWRSDLRDAAECRGLHKRAAI
jgi:hypothetical protein